MRPPLNAGENAHRRACRRRERDSGCFNEAPAERGGKRRRSSGCARDSAASLQ